MFKALEAYNAQHEKVINKYSKPSYEARKVTKALVTIDKKIKRKQIKKDETYKTIPKFFFDQQKKNVVGDLLDALAFNSYLQKRWYTHFRSSDLDTLWELLLTNSEMPSIEGEERITYKKFQHIGSLVKDVAAQIYFSPFYYLLQDRDPKTGSISILEHYNIMLKKSFLYQQRVKMAVFDKSRTGVLTRQELLQYIQFMIDDNPPLASNLSSAPTFRSFYERAIVELFFFLLDTNRREKLSIEELVFSDYFINFTEVCEDQSLDQNIFTVHRIYKIWEKFNKMNITGRGCLSRNEMISFNNFALTGAFVQRFIEEYAEKNRFISWETFIYFYQSYYGLSTSRAARRFIWRCIDINHDGYITPFILNVFLREIIKKFGDEEPLKVDDLINEIYCLISPKKKDGNIYLDDVLDHEKGGDFLGLLISVELFNKYENTESSGPVEEEEEEPPVQIPAHLL